MTEKAGKAEGVTEYDSEFESLCHQFDQIKLTTEHMLTHVESIVQPNPSMSVNVILQVRPQRCSPRDYGNRLKVIVTSYELVHSVDLQLILQATLHQLKTIGHRKLKSFQSTI